MPLRTAAMSPMPQLLIAPLQHPTAAVSTSAPLATHHRCHHCETTSALVPGGLASEYRSRHHASRALLRSPYRVSSALLMTPLFCPQLMPLRVSPTLRLKSPSVQNNVVCDEVTAWRQAIIGLQLQS
ncbi:hypothetical protein CHARACLAT_018503 [Characodon lateralis]|uniref:Uncharacterized protein n=1 Tax=Characodon lateralis TaxID=208331 RepID=A0ABU7E1L1_9TELE|nr:hypothetical protein [Characodon lateralis]